jgi:hypothetical protein
VAAPSGDDLPLILLNRRSTFGSVVDGPTFRGYLHIDEVRDYAIKVYEDSVQNFISGTDNNVRAGWHS